MEFDTGRRRFLELAGTGTAVSLAGCSALQQGTSPQTTTEASSETATDSESRQVTVAVRADQQKLQQRQQEIASEVRAGNVSRSEAQQQFQAAQQELLSESVTSFEEQADARSALSIVDSVEQFGVFLIDGPATTLIETLSFASVNALLPEATFQQAKRQAQQQQTQEEQQESTPSTEESTATTTSN